MLPTVNQNPSHLTTAVAKPTVLAKKGIQGKNAPSPEPNVY